MASLGNTIINGILRINGKLIVGESITAPSFIGKLKGNADTATSAATLTTARTINGTNFNGSENITTANWGIARNIGIVNSDGTGTAVTVSVNGSANTNLKLPATIKASLSGNANTATKLQTARTINGTSFDGSTNITTANWGTARNIGIINSDGTGTAVTVSVNGSGNVNLKLPAAIKASLTGNADTASKLHTARTINGTSFDGSGNITTANWGTARNVTIQDSTAAHSGTAVSVNGSGNINLKLPATIAASLSGNASTASKLQTARNIAVTGSVSGNANFDGSANINISVNRKGATVGQSGSTNTKPWYKAASLSQKSGNNDNHIMFSVYSTYADASTKVGILKIHLRTTGDGKWSSSDIVWLSKSNNISVSDFVLAHNTNVNPTVVELWCKCNQGYQGYNFDVISEGNRVGRNSEWTMYNTWTTGSQDAPTNGYTQQTSTLLTLANPISGNATTATKLQTARTIGVSGVTGTAQSFNGTANIVIPITAVPASLLTGKNAIKGSEINNDKHWIPSSNSSVTNFVAMTSSSFASSASSLPTGTIVAITDGVEGYVTTQATSLTCELPLDL